MRRASGVLALGPPGGVQLSSGRLVMAVHGAGGTAALYSEDSLTWTLGAVSHRLLSCVSAAFVAKTLPLPCASTDFVANTPPLPRVSAAFTTETRPFLADIQPVPFDVGVTSGGESQLVRPCDLPRAFPRLFTVFFHCPFRWTTSAPRLACR